MTRRRDPRLLRGVSTLRPKCARRVVLRSAALGTWRRSESRHFAPGSPVAVAFGPLQHAMPNGKVGDHPFTDIVIHGRRVYSERADALVREIDELGGRERIADVLWR